MHIHFFDLFKGLTKKEQAAFGQYLEGLYPNQRIAIRAFRALKVYWQHNTPMDEAQVLLEAFGEGAAVNIKDLQNTFYDLKVYLIEFLSWQAFRQQSNYAERQLLALDALYQRGWTDMYLQQSAQIQKRLTELSEPDMWNALTKVKLAYRQYFFASHGNQEGDHTVLHTLLLHLDQFYAAAKLLCACEWLSLNSVKGAQPMPFQEDELLTSVTHLADDFWPVHFYSQVFAMIHNDDEATFQMLKAMFLTNPPRDVITQSFLLMYLLNFLSRSARLKTQDTLEDTFELCRHGVDRNLFVVHGFFAVGAFNNIVNLACSLKKFDWATAFIKTSGRQLHPSEQKNMQALFEAKVLFEMGEYEKLIPVLQNIKYSNFIYEVQARLLLIRCYYVLHPNDRALQHSCINLYNLTRRSGYMGDDYQKAVLGFLRVLKALIARKPKDLLIALLAQQSHIFCQPWLEEQIKKQ